MNVFCFCSHLPPSQGGKYAGFGYTKDPIPKSQSQEFFDSTVSSLASVSGPWYIMLCLGVSIFSSLFSFQGWSMFSFGATKVANTAKDNVSRYGNLAGQKVTQ